MNEFYEIGFIRLLGALAAGSLIGIERNLHGRPAGLRTHAIVSLSTSMLMLLPFYYELTATREMYEYLRLDPTRMAQGIMTGIGFLGAGVIIKESYSIRGLTTAASIWLSSALGIMFGAGLYFPALAAMVLSLAALSFYRLVENNIPSMRYAKLRLKINKKGLDDRLFLEILQKYNIRVSKTSYRKTAGRGYLFYEMTMHSRNEYTFERLYSELIKW
ncbi:MAG: MgtC/SapB family protein, partial [Spirochaetia bacterium]|nr:MgtC/SapB family protein [Spirochaetia bacterium]